MNPSFAERLAFAAAVAREGYYEYANVADGQT